MKKLISLVLALAMIMMVGAAFADTATLAKDAGIEIIGLETGDSVKIYQVLQWNTNVGWGKTTAFNSLKDASVTTLVGQPGTIDPATNTVVGAVSGALTPAIATEIKGIYDANPTMNYAASADARKLTDGFGVAFTDIPAGLYMALITSGSSIVTYNPVFVSCDYSRGNDDPLSLYANLTVANVGYAKKTTDFEVDKLVKDAEGTAFDEWATAEKDEILTFTVDTTIPSYYANEWDVDKIAYAVKDHLNGLALVNDPTHVPQVQVKPVASTGNFTDLAATNYTLSAANGSTDLTLDIAAAYLKTIEGPYSLKLTYYAKVTDAAVTNVSATDNKVTVEYSNDPTDSTKKGTKHDITNHYKFALDAELFGDSEYHTSELVKVGLDGAGQPIYEKTGYSNYSTHSALEGAKFGLYNTKDAALAAMNTPNDGTGLISNADGKFLIGNLDAGTYYLVETKAPDGYIRDNTIYEIVITATEKHVTIDDGDCTFTTDVLDTYTVKINAIEGSTTTTIATSTYTMEYTGTPTNGTYTLETIKLKSSSKVTEEEKENHPEDNTSEIRNRKGTELPSTGGIGTTIFYIVGGILLVGAAVILVARRKAQD